MACSVRLTSMHHWLFDARTGSGRCAPLGFAERIFLNMRKDLRRFRAPETVVLCEISGRFARACWKSVLYEILSRVKHRPPLAAGAD